MPPRRHQTYQSRFSGTPNLPVLTSGFEPWLFGHFQGNLASCRLFNPPPSLFCSHAKIFLLAHVVAPLIPCVTDGVMLSIILIFHRLTKHSIWCAACSRYTVWTTIMDANWAIIYQRHSLTFTRTWSCTGYVLGPSMGPTSHHIASYRISATTTLS